MKTLLILDSSARRNRSTTRRLTARLGERWLARIPDGRLVHRDLGAAPPPPIDEAWIAAAFGSNSDETSPLAHSEQLIDELFRADAIVIGAPMYNFGMPAALKAYLDQIVRVGRTFDFTGDEEEPYRALLPAKPVLVVTSAGAGGFEPGGPLAASNFLDPHLAAVLGFIGLGEVSFARAQFEEFKDERWRASLAEAEAKLETWLDQRASGAVR